MIDGDGWDGVVWMESTGNCWCQKNDRDHTELSDRLHFRAQQ